MFIWKSIYLDRLIFQAILGKIVKRPALLNKKLIRELKALASPEDPYNIVTGKTMCTNDFYEGTYSRFRGQY
jgi:uridine phosphorylase